MAKMANFKSFWNITVFLSNSVTRQLNFELVKNAKIEILIRYILGGQKYIK